MQRVSVAMCTFNGSLYVRAQLDSIAAQSRPPDEIVVCDDRSNDNTVSIIREFAKSVDIPVRIEVNGHGLGTILNFDKAISLCRGDIVFLSDQDDIWQPHKIARMLELIGSIAARHTEPIPILVHSDLEVVGPALEPVAQSFMRYQGISPEENTLGVLLLHNVVTGCACAFNRPLVEFALPIPENSLMHDWWLALMASTQGEIGFLPEALVRYRQHGSNTVGAKQSAVQPLWRAIRRNSPEQRAYYRKMLELTVGQAEKLRQRLIERGRHRFCDLATVTAYADIPATTRLRRPWAIIRHGIRRQRSASSRWRSVTRQILFIFAVTRL